MSVSKKQFKNTEIEILEEKRRITSQIDQNNKLLKNLYEKVNFINKCNDYIETRDYSDILKCFEKNNRCEFADVNDVMKVENENRIERCNILSSRLNRKFTNAKFECKEGKVYVMMKK
jgi:hypothetical protein